MAKDILILTALYRRSRKSGRGGGNFCPADCNGRPEAGAVFYIAMVNDGRGVTVWLTGLSGAGKTTISRALAKDLRGRGRRVEILDGDEVRRHLSRGLGFSAEGRNENVRRIGYVAHLLSRNGVIVIVAAISPYRSSRLQVRELTADFVEVHVSTPLAVCEKRDAKGLYRKARSGEIQGFTGVSDPYEPPENAEVVVDTTDTTVETAVEAILRRLGRGGYV